MKKVTYSLILFLSLIFKLNSYAQNPPTVTLHDTTFYVTYIQNTDANNNVIAEVWFKIDPNASTQGDKEIFHFTFNQGTMGDYLNAACTIKKEFDDSKTVIGCLSVVTSVFCAVGTAATDGAMATVCTATWDYAIDGKGAANCLEGVTGMFFSSLGKSYEWEILGTAAGIVDPQLSEAIEHGINLLCENIKNQN